VSIDTPETSRKFAQVLGADYPLLSDPTRAAATAYGVIPPGAAWPLRWTFFVGMDGKILYIDKQVSPSTHGQAIADRLAELGVPRRTPRRR
jgi:peroxiredoxin Q/BCP